MPPIWRLAATFSDLKWESLIVRTIKFSTALLSGVLLVGATVTGTVMLTTARTPPASAQSHYTAPRLDRELTATSIVLSTSAASPAAQGAPLMLTATVTPAVAAGTVQFKDGSTNLGTPVTVSNGSATQNASTLTVGTHQLTAVFTPDNPTAYSPSTSAVLPFTISGASATSTVLSTSVASPAAQGASVTLTATLTPSSAIGMVQFKDNATNANIGAPVPVTNGVATQTTSTLAVGTHQLVAVFTPTSTTLYSPSTSPPVPFTISGAAVTSTMLNVSSTATPVVVGSTVSLVAAVTPVAAAGTVQFRDGATNIGDPVAVTNGTASTTTTTLTAGSHDLTAVFTPTDATLYTTSISPTVTFVVNGATAATTTLATSPARQVFENTPVAMTATLAPSAAAGTVQFRDGTTLVGAPVAVANGTATRSATFGVGSHQLTATFTPTTATLYSPSVSSAVTVNVARRPLVGAAVTPPGRDQPPGDRGFQPSGPLDGLRGNPTVSMPAAEDPAIAERGQLRDRRSMYSGSYAASK